MFCVYILLKSDRNSQNSMLFISIWALLWSKDSRDGMPNLPSNLMKGHQWPGWWTGQPWTLTRKFASHFKGWIPSKQPAGCSFPSLNKLLKVQVLYPIYMLECANSKIVNFAFMHEWCFVLDRQEYSWIGCLWYSVQIWVRRAQYL